ncbi:MAG TPA: hypothetical protein VMX17_03630 [Candidatus Glassbacteria bacterium]|nr:hypothetical protein [Candidatus Glassbacteria bacterium]
MEIKEMIGEVMRIKESSIITLYYLEQTQYMEREIKKEKEKITACNQALTALTHLHNKVNH